MENPTDIMALLEDMKKDLEQIKKHTSGNSITEAVSLENLKPIDVDVENLKPIDVDVTLCADLFKALSNEERLKLLTALGREDHYFAQLIELSNLDNSPLRFHLTILKEVNLISQERFRGKYTITDLGRQALSISSYFFHLMCEQEVYK